MKEIWKDVPGYEGLYQASTLGRIRSFKRFKGRDYSRVMKTTHNKNGKVWYDVVAFLKDGISTKFTVHQLIWNMFMGPIPDGLELNHKNGNKSDCRLTNLELMTHAENVKHAYRIGLTPSRRGEGNTKAVLTDAIVLQMREEYKQEMVRRHAAGKCNVSKGFLKSRASTFGVTTEAIKNAIYGDGWSHLNG